MTTDCGCCEGVAVVTPQPVANRPGLGALARRVGTHATFLQTMLARLSSSDHPELAALRTRDTGDFSIALLDACAAVADVLTFYQERLANEGYLRTATERPSIQELGRLVGYALRPGVAAGVFLAYTLEAGQDAVIPAGTRSQSVPGPGELPQSFETSESLSGRADWNDLTPRQTRPQVITGGNASTIDTLYLEGTTTGLKAGDLLLIVADGQNVLRNVTVVEPQVPASPADPGSTKVTLDGSVTNSAKPTIQHTNGGSGTALDRFNALLQPLSRAPSSQPRDASQLALGTSTALGSERDPTARLVAALNQLDTSTLYAAWSSAPLTPSSPAKVYAFRVRAPLFGYNTPVLRDSTGAPATNPDPPSLAGDEGNNRLFLDNAYDRITAGIESYAVLESLNPIDNTDVTVVQNIFNVTLATVLTRTAYGVSGKTTMLQLSDCWWNTDLEHFGPIRGTTVYAQSEQLPLAEEPVDGEVCGDRIELGALYDGLRAGRWAAVSGERTDVPGAAGVTATEVVMIAGVEQSVAQSAGTTLPGDSVHSTLILASPLAYCYQRDTVAIQGNVVPATHGETRQEVLGSGDATQSLQSFALRQKPLTYVSAPTPAGIASTLHVRVDGVEWQLADSLASRGPTERVFVTETDDQDQTTVVFGTGENGARLPTGVENVTAIYRTGIGSAGNVDAGSITLPTTRPLGVQKVVNPLRASGGADRETGDQARGNVPLAMQALDRLVSVSDYAALSRQFGGVARAAAARLSDGSREVVHVTIAGAGDAPIDDTSDLLHNLRAALRDFGDPFVPVVIRPRELLLLVISAAVSVGPAYRWEDVAPAVRAALLDAFGFERRDLGQSVFLSEVVGVIQQVPGVAYSDVNAFGGVTADQPTAPTTVAPCVQASLALPDPNATDGIRPAQLAYLSPDIAETLILTELTS